MEIIIVSLFSRLTIFITFVRCKFYRNKGKKFSFPDIKRLGKLKKETALEKI